MRIRRGPLFWGLFLIPLGAIPLLQRAGIIDLSAVGDVWRLWPLVLVILGLALLLGRTSAGLVGTAGVAILLGVMGGSILATGPSWIGAIGECGPDPDAMQQVDESGTFEGPASAAFELGCGTFELTTQVGDGWRAAAAYRGSAPTVDVTSTSIDVRTPGSSGGRQEWTVALPVSQIRDVHLRTNASTGSMHLDGAALGSLRTDLNAGDLLIDGAASIERLAVTANAGRVRVSLGQGSTSGSLSVNAGAIDLCVPADAALVFDVREQLTFATNLDDRGLTQNGSTWTRAGTGGSISLSVEGNAASFTLDPDGGCR
jgi:Domain of unknown function (DUF5668)